MRVFGIFPVEIVKEDFPGEGLMDVAVIKGIPPGKSYGVYYAEKLDIAAVVIDLDDLSTFTDTWGSINLSKEDLGKTEICPDFNVDTLEKRLP